MKGVSQNGQTPSIIGICSYCVLDRPVYERCQTLLHPKLTPWWSFLLADGAHHKKPHSPTHPLFWETDVNWSLGTTWLVNCFALNHYLNQYWLFVRRTQTNIFGEHLGDVHTSYSSQYMPWNMQTVLLLSVLSGFMWLICSNITVKPLV